MTPEDSARVIYDHLTNALSPDANTRQSAEAALRAAEETQDFFASLAAIAVAPDAEADPNVRWLAAVLTKNAVPRSWRRNTRQNAVSDDERDYVRGLLLDALGEPRSTIATQLSVCTAAIARIDFPSHWPNVLPDLLERVRTGSPPVMMHALTTLDMVLKQLASRRLRSDRLALFRQGPSTFETVFGLFVSRLPYLDHTQHPQNVVSDAFQVVIRCLKSFRRLISYACEEPSHLLLVPQLFAKLVEHPKIFFNGADGGTELQRRLSLLTAKLIRVTHERHPIAFQPYLLTFLQRYYETLVAFDANKSDDRVCFHVAFFLKNVFRCTDYGINTASISHFQEKLANSPTPEGISSESCRYIVLKFFDENVTQNLVEVMIGKVFILNQNELDTWASDPETLVREEEAAGWGTENLRHECEELFKMLLIRNKQTVIPSVLKLAESIPKENALLLDACYRAVGRAVYDVQGAFDIDAWLQDRLLHILSASCGIDLGERIIQGRTVWLVSQYAEQLSRESRIAVYPHFVRLMSATEHDRVIALTAAKGMRYLVEDLGFVDSDLAPHLDNCLSSLLQLISVSDSYETKKDLVETISSVISACRASYVTKVVDPIATHLPRIWEEKAGTTSRNTPAGRDIDSQQNEMENRETGGAEVLLRTQIVSLLRTILTKVGAPAARSEALRRVLYPIVDYAIDPHPSKGGAFMLEDGCDLWGALVVASEEYTEFLNNLFPRTNAILDADHSCLPRIFALTKSYALLGREPFVQQFAQVFMKTIESSIDSVRGRGCFSAVELLDLILRLFPGEAVRASAGTLRHVLQKALADIESENITSAYVGLVCRAILANVEDVENFVFERDEQTCLDVLDVIIKHLDTMRRLPSKKLAMLSVCGLITRYVGSASVRSRLPVALNGIVQVLAEESQKEKRLRTYGDKGSDFGELFAKAAGKKELPENDPLDATMPEEVRLKALEESDMVAKLSLKQTCSEMLQGMSSACGVPVEQLMTGVDQAIVGQLKELLA